MLRWARKHRALTGLLIMLIAVSAFLGYRASAKKESGARYIAAEVRKGTLVISVSGTGQVLPADQVDIKAKVSGELTYVGAENGKEVNAGTLLFKVDDADAAKAVRDAERNLQMAKLELDKLLEPPKELDLVTAENSLADAKQALKKAKDALSKSYEDAFNAVVQAWSDYSSAISLLDEILCSSKIEEAEGIGEFSGYDNLAVLENSVNSDNRPELQRLVGIALSSYDAARGTYQQNFTSYTGSAASPSKSEIKALLKQATATAKPLRKALMDTSNLLGFWIDYRVRTGLPVFGSASNYQSDVCSYLAKINGHIATLTAARDALSQGEDSIESSQRAVEEKELYIQQLKAGPDELDIKSKKIAVQQKEDELAQARQRLADYQIAAPFNGIITNVNAKEGDSISPGAVLATLVSREKIAQVTLNEVDIPQVKLGQKANITFDAIEGLNITGKVIEIDALGTVTQGVVTYNVKIAFDTQDERVKPGMSVSTDIITNVKQDVLLVPNSAVKRRADGTHYVELVTNKTAYAADKISARDIRIQPVEIGLANDSTTEIINGLKEGDIVVTQTISTQGGAAGTQRGQLQRLPIMIR